MPYTASATVAHPSLIIFVVDQSASMGKMAGEKRKIELAREALESKMVRMLRMSVVNTRVKDQYRVAILGYSHAVKDFTGGVRSLSEAVQQDLPELRPEYTSDASMAFCRVEELLQEQLPGLQDSPPPLVCHITDGAFSGTDLQPAIERIRRMGVPDGQVLVEHIFVGDGILPEAVEDLYRWPGILPSSHLVPPAARRLRDLSSPLPESYQTYIQSSGYGIQPGAVMMWPHTCSELFELSLPQPMRS